MNCMCACECMLPRTNQSQIIPFLLSLPVLSLSLSLLIFPLTHSLFAKNGIWAICWHQPAACMAWKETVAHHPSSVISTLERFRGREGGMWSRSVGVSTVGKQAEGQKLEPENQVPKTKWWCVFSTQLFFLYSSFTLCYYNYFFLNARSLLISMWLHHRKWTQRKNKNDDLCWKK